MSILITGGAGYIGSHTVKYFQEKGEEVIVLDNLQSGHVESVDVKYFYNYDIRDRNDLIKVFSNHNIEAVIHFAANSLVGESIKNPYDYYHNNVYGLLSLLNVMKSFNTKYIVFSSTAAVYGEPKNIPITEDQETLPTNTYGETKLTMEKMMKWFARAHDMKYISLRYFNACGADPNGKIGEDHYPESHLIPLVLEVPLGKRKNISIFGNDYKTKDGTCIRDYIHVLDLASAHYMSLQHLRNGKESNVFNLGSGKGYSVKEIIEIAREVTDHFIPVEIKGRREGDPAILIASSQKAKKILGWAPQYDSIKKIITDAWRWHKKNPKGYNGNI